MIFNKEDMQIVECIWYNGHYFENEESLVKYIDSCDCEYNTYNFISELEDNKEYMSDEELYITFDINPDDEDAEEQLYEIERQYNSYLYNLLDTYQIDFKFHKYTIQGPYYTLIGTFGNMKAFAKKYSSYLDMSNPGEALYDIEKKADIDFDSGDKEYILK